MSLLFDRYGDDSEHPKHQRLGGVIGFLLHYRRALGLNGDQTERLAEGKVTLHYSDYDWQLNAFTDEWALSERE